MLHHRIEGTGPIVLFIHGFALDARMWSPQVAALSATYRVVVVDLPSFGPAAVDVGEQTAARALIEVLDTIGDDPVHVVGLSLGGAVATDLALAFKARVRSLTLIDGLLRGRPTGIKKWAEAAAHAKAGDLDAARAAWLDDDLFATARARPEVLTTLKRMASDYAGDHWRDLATTRFDVADPAAQLGEVDVPALVIVGERDLPTFRAMADEYATALPHATLEVVEGAGHLANLEAPDRVNALLARFLGESKA